jgi:hypothetical protein
MFPMAGQPTVGIVSDPALEYPTTGPIGRFRDLVWSCVQRYYRRGPEPAEDLMQVGYAGLIAAINKFDPAFGCSLAPMRVPT